MSLDCHETEFTLREQMMDQPEQSASSDNTPEITKQDKNVRLALAIHTRGQAMAKAQGIGLKQLMEYSLRYVCDKLDSGEVRFSAEFSDVKEGK